MTQAESNLFSDKIARKIAEAKNQPEIQSILVNELKSFFLYEQAAIVKKTFWGGHRVEAINGLIEIDQSSPYAVWLRRLSRLTPATETVETFDSGSSINPGNWENFSAAFLMTIPLTETYLTQKTLFLFRSTPWALEEKNTANIIGNIATGALSRPKIRGEIAAKKRRRKTTASVVIFVVLMSLIPVRLSSIAPAETIPTAPFLIAPAFPAVVKNVLVNSNEEVKENQVLVELDDVDQRAKAQVAHREMEVAEAELRKYSQLGFQDQNSRYRLAEALGQVNIKKLQLERANLELDRTKLKTPVAGVAIIVDPLDWVGRPVQTGEKILLVADPKKNHVRIWVPATDGAILNEGLSGELFLDSDPWVSRKIHLKNWSFEPELSPQGIMAFRAQAIPNNEAWPHPMVGLHGVVHLSGKRIPLLLYLLRKPIIFMRQIFAI